MYQNRLCNADPYVLSEDKTVLSNPKAFYATSRRRNSNGLRGVGKTEVGVQKKGKPEAGHAFYTACHEV